MPRTNRNPPVKSMLIPEGLFKSRKPITVRAAPPNVEISLSADPTLRVLDPVEGGMALVSAIALTLVVKLVVSMLNQVKLFAYSFSWSSLKNTCLHLL